MFLNCSYFYNYPFLPSVAFIFANFSCLDHLTYLCAGKSACLSIISQSKGYFLLKHLDLKMASLGLFLAFGKIRGLCSYQIVLIEKRVQSDNSSSLPTKGK